MNVIGRLRRLIFGARESQGAISDTTTITVGELQKAPMPSFMADACIGFSFCATIQLRTPLRVLLRHGEFYADVNTPPPEIAKEMWEGIWVHEARPIAGISFHGGTMASDVGPIPIDGGDYFPFLIAVRTIVETRDPIEVRIEKLREMQIEPRWQDFVSKHRGIDGIIQSFFPKFINLPAGLDTPNRIAAASDELLLGIKGIGPAKLKAIRARCACITENRDSDRVDNVVR